MALMRVTIACVLAAVACTLTGCRGFCERHYCPQQCAAPCYTPTTCGATPPPPAPVYAPRPMSGCTCTCPPQQ